MRIVAYTKYDSLAASTRQRLLQYIPSLEAAGISVDYRPLLGQDYVQSLASGTGFSKAAVGRSYVKRLAELMRDPGADLIWVYAELFPYLPALFERLAFRAGKPLVYDFDDAFFHQHEEHHNPVMRRLLSGKLQPLLKGAAACCCGNSYLRDYAARFCDNSIILPTVVDTAIYRPRETSSPDRERLVVGWIGSPSTWCNVRPVLPLLQRLCQERTICVRAMGAGPEAEKDRFPGLELVEWTQEAEVDEVRNMDIGIMPLLDLPFQRGKSGYKLVQYMACGLPVVASPVGVNANIIVPGVNGFLAAEPEQWRSALLRLIEQPELRASMGAAGRARAVSEYSVASQAPRLVALFRALAAPE